MSKSQTNSKKTVDIESVDMEAMLNKVAESESQVVLPTHSFRFIPKGMVAFSGQDKDGRPIEGYQTPAGAKAMKDYVEANGGILNIDEKKKEIAVPIHLKMPFNNSKGCKNCH